MIGEAVWLRASGAYPRLMELGKIRRILVPTDFSETADEALGVATAMARAFGATVELVHVAASAMMVLPPPLELVSFGALFPDLSQKVQDSLQTRSSS